MSLIRQELIWVLSKTAEFNRREFHNFQDLLHDLTEYRQTTKIEKYQTIIQAINQSSNKNEIVQLFEAWKVLLESERIYADVLKLKAFQDVPIIHDFKVKSCSLKSLNEPREMSTSKENVNRKKIKKLKINFNFFSSMKKNVFVNKKGVGFNEKVTMIEKHLEKNLIEHFSTFVTSCKRFSLVNSEDNLDLDDLLEANQKFHCDLFILQQKVNVAYNSLKDEITNIESDSFFETDYDLNLLNKLLDNWSIYYLIISVFNMSITALCSELQNDAFKKLPKTPKSRNKKLSNASLESSVSVTLADYVQHEHNVNKMLVEHISEVIVQLSINKPETQGFQRLIAELKDCLNLFKRRCNARKQLSPKVDDYSDDEVFLLKLEEVEVKELNFASWENLAVSI